MVKTQPLFPQGDGCLWLWTGAAGRLCGCTCSRGSGLQSHVDPSAVKENWDRVGRLPSALLEVSLRSVLSGSYGHRTCREVPGDGACTCGWFSSSSVLLRETGARWAGFTPHPVWQRSWTTGNTIVFHQTAKERSLTFPPLQSQADLPVKESFLVQFVKDYMLAYLIHLPHHLSFHFILFLQLESVVSIQMHMKKIDELKQNKTEITLFYSFPFLSLSDNLVPMRRCHLIPVPLSYIPT